MPKLTAAQQRMVAAIAAAEPRAEYWPIVNDWVKDTGPAKALAFRNIERTVNALLRAKVVALDDDGLLSVVKGGGR